MQVLLALLVFFAAVPAAAQQTGERFEYEVSWGYADVGHVTLQRGCPRDGYRPAKLSAKSQGVIEQLHSFVIKLDSFTALTGRSLEGRTFIEEEGVPRRYKTRFSATGSAVTQKTYRRKDSTLRLALRPGTHDLLSWFFALRATSMAAATSASFHVWDGWKLARVTAAIGKVERVWTSAGTFDAHKVSLSRQRLHHTSTKSYQPNGKPEEIGTVWFTDDDAHAPIAMDFRVPLGVAKLRLVRQTATICR